MHKGWPKGKPRGPQPNRYKTPRTPINERAWRYILPDPNSGCWHWVGAADKLGYGYIVVNDQGPNQDTPRMRKAHRVVYEIYKGPIPEGLVLDHLRRVPCCVNPDHLEPVKQAENMRRGLNVGMTPQCKAAGYAYKAAITHCPHGHEYTTENTAYSRGKRVCKACRRKHGQRSQIIRTERARQARLAAKLAA